LAIASFGGIAHAQPPPLVVNELLLSAGGGTAQFVEVRALQSVRLDGDRYYVEVFDPNGASLGTVDAGGLGGGQFAPEYYVLASTAAETALSFTADALLDVYLPSEGQLCLFETIGVDTRAVHCIGWGCVLAPVHPSSIPTPAPPDGQSTQRPNDLGGGYVLAAPTPGILNAASGTAAEPCAERDAGPLPPLPDAGTPEDGGTIVGGGTGCGCTIPGRKSSTPAFFAWAAVFWALRAQRRSRRRAALAPTTKCASMNA
jgi:hypothetical protein